MTEYSVEIQPDFLERQSKAQPVSAVAELIWNSLDADATTVTIDFENDGLGGMAKIVVMDNGHGIPFSDAPTLFRNLGGSWKKRAARTKT
jgi:DNA topoisomerase VI subunit B